MFFVLLALFALTVSSYVLSTTNVVYNRIYQTGFTLNPRAYAVAGRNASGVIIAGGEGALTQGAAYVDPSKSAVVWYTTGSTLSPDRPLNGVTYRADRAAYASVYSETDSTYYRIVAHGGIDSTGADVAGTYMLNPDTLTWSAVTTTGPSPSARSLHNGVFLPHCSNITGDSYLTASTDTSIGCFVVFGGLSGGVRKNDADVLYFNFPSGAVATTPYWYQPAELAIGAPSARHSSALVAGMNGHYAYLFGGDTGSTLNNDVFMLAPEGFSDYLPSEMRSISDGRTVTISSLDTLSGGLAQSVTNGVVGTTHNPTYSGTPVAGQNRCAQTNLSGTTNPFVRVDLGASVRFDGIEVFGRSDFKFGSDVTNGNIADFLALFARNEGYAIIVGNDPTWNGANNVECPSISDDLDGARAFLPCPTTSARYVFMVLKGANRVLAVCQLRVLVKRQWTWRQLSLTGNVASGMYASATSEDLISHPIQVTDGILSNDFTSGLMMTTGASANVGQFCNGCFQEIRVDLQYEYQATSISVYARGDSGINATIAGSAFSVRSRNLGWIVAIGNAVDTRLNTVCTLTSANLGDVTPIGYTGATPVAAVFTCPSGSIGRYVSIRRYWPNGGGNTYADDVISVGEIVVNAPYLSYAPTPRAGMASAALRGHMVIFGGYNANGMLLNEVRMFSMIDQNWAPYALPASNAPYARSYATLSEITPSNLWPATRAVLAGGITNQDAIQDMWELRFAGSYNQFDLTGVLNINFLQGHTVMYFSCYGGFVDRNQGQPVVLLPDNTWLGFIPPCVGAAPSVPLNAVNTPIVGGALVSWSPPASGGYYNTIDFYRVRSTTGDDIVYEFGVADELPPTWDPTGSSRFRVPGDGHMYVEAIPGAVCDSVSNTCPRAILTMPDATKNYNYNAHVGPSDLSAGIDGFETGICIYDRGYKGVGGCQLSLVVRRQGVNGYTVVWKSSATTNFEVVQQAIPYRASGTGTFGSGANSKIAYGGAPMVYLKIDHTQTQIINGTSQVVYTAFWRLSPLKDWEIMPRIATNADLFNRTAIPQANLTVAGIVNAPTTIQIPSQTGNFRGMVVGEFDFLASSHAGCIPKGPDIYVPSTQNFVRYTGGLVSTYSYSLAIDACNYIAGCGTGARPATVRPLSDPVIPDVSRYVNVAVGKVATWFYAGQGGSISSASLAVDGITNQTYNNANNLPQCAVSSTVPRPTSPPSLTLATDSFPTWYVDLGIMTDVAIVKVLNVNDRSPQFLTGFIVMVSETADSGWQDARDCDILTNYDFSSNITAGSYTISVDCNLKGRYVWIRLPYYDVSLQLCEVQVLAPNSCPVRSAKNGAIAPVVQSYCSGATYGQPCTHTCLPGFRQVFGSTLAYCSGKSWTGGELVCEAVCPDLPIDPLINMCTRTLAYDTFDATGPGIVIPGNVAPAFNYTLTGLNVTLNNVTFGTDDRWRPLDSRHVWGTYFFETDGALIAASRPGCLTELQIVYDRGDIRSHTGIFMLSAVVNTARKAGLIWHATDGGDMYRFYADAIGSRVVFELVNDFVVFEIMSVPYSIIGFHQQGMIADIRLWLQLRVVGNNGDYQFFVNNTNVMHALDRSFLQGSVGLYSQTTARFDLFNYSIPCEGTSVSGAVNGDNVFYVCKPGFQTNLPGNNPGYLNNTCVLNSNYTSGNWAIPAPVCQLANPTLRSGVVINIPDTLSNNDPIGQPMEIYNAPPDEPFIWDISPTTNVNNPLYIEACSGQIRIKNISAVVAAMNYTAGSGRLTPGVRVTYVNYPGQSSQQTVTVNIVAGPRPPTIVNKVFTMLENRQPGYVVGNLAAFSVNNYQMSYLIAQDNAVGRFQINNNGDIVVANLNPFSGGTGYSQILGQTDTSYATSPSWTFVAEVYATTVPTQYSFATITINLVDINDPPRYNGNGILTLQDTAAFIGAPFPASQYLPVAYTDVDTIPTFRAPNVVSLFSIVPPNIANNLRECRLNGFGSNNLIPTVDGRLNSTQLFSIINPLTGALAINAMPIIPYMSMPTYLYQGLNVRHVYDICVNASDSLGAFSLALIPIAITASSFDPTVIAFAAPAPMATAGGQTVTFTINGTFYANLAAPTETLSALLDNGRASYLATNCNMTFRGQFSSSGYCIVPPGVGANLIWNIRRNDVPMLNIASTLTSYAAPIITSIQPDAPTVGTISNNTVFSIYGQNFGSPVTYRVNMSNGIIWVSTPAVDDRSSVLGRVVGLLDPTQYIAVVQVQDGATLTKWWGPKCTSPIASDGTFGCPPFNAGVNDDTAASVIVYIFNTSTPAAAYSCWSGCTSMASSDAYAYTSIIGRRAGCFTGFTYGASGEHRGFPYRGLIGVAPDFDTHYYLTVQPGQGRAYPFTFNLGGTNAANPNALTLSYARPMIYGVTLTSPGAGYPANFTFGTPELAVTGGQTFYVYGANFGPATFPDNAAAIPISVTYGGLGGNLFAATGCVRIAPNVDQFLQCVTGPGTGANLPFQITAMSGGAYANTMLTVSNGQTTLGTGFTYSGPTITGLSGPAQVRGPTTGGAAIYITGTQFGTIASNPSILFVYGPVGNMRYTAASCTVTAQLPSTPTITCYSAPGVGSNHVAQIILNGQSSPVFNLTTISYAPPSLTSLAGPGAVNGDTRGNQTVLLNGLNFGPNDAYTISQLVVTYGIYKLADTYQGTGVSTNISIVASCIISIPHTQISCTTAPGAGAFLNWVVVVAGQALASPTSSYATPVITGITGTLLLDPNVVDANGVVTTHTLTGNFFGPSASYVQDVSFGATGTQYILLPSVSGIGFSYISQTAIQIRVPPASGTVLRYIVEVADQLSAVSTVTFGFRAPVIFSMSTTSVDTLNDPVNPYSITMSTRYLPFLDRFYAWRVYIGTAPFIYRVPLDVPSSPAAISADTNPDGSQNVSFVYPSFIGKNLPVRIVQEWVGQPGVAAYTYTAPQTLSYNDPVITSITVIPAVFSTGGVNATADQLASSLVFPCPWAVNNPTWSCNNATFPTRPLYLVVLNGYNFGQNPATTLFPDGVTRTLEIQGTVVRNGTVIGSSTIFSNTAIYPFAWTENRVLGFTYVPTGNVRVRYNVGATTWSATATYAMISPQILSVTGAVTNVPTTGGTPAAPITLRVNNIGQADSIYVTIGGNICPLVTAIGVPITDSLSSIITSQSPGPWTVYCVPPAGQGSSNPIVVQRVIGNITTPSDGGFRLAYAPPSILYAWEFDYLVGTWVSSPVSLNTIVSVPTNGSRVRVIGTNLGNNPTIWAFDRYIFTSTNATNRVYPCTGTNWVTGMISATGAAVITGNNFVAGNCYEFVTPAGEGLGYGLPEYAVAGFYLQLYAGDQSTTPMSVVYQAPIVQSISSSTTFPTTGGPLLTIRGLNFGQPNSNRAAALSNVRVYLGRPVDGFASYFLCTGVTRVSHFVITCTLPAGTGGNGMAARVYTLDNFGETVLTTFNYDKPTVSSIWAVNGVYPSPGTECATQVYQIWNKYANASVLNSTQSCVAIPGSPAAIASATILALNPNIYVPPQGAYGVTGGAWSAGLTNNIMLRGPATPGTTTYNSPTYVTILGTNFGALNPVHCVGLLISSRQSGRTLVCDTAEDWQGEGEVASVQVIAWTPTRVVFIVPDGIGLKDVDVNIRGQGFAFPLGSAQWPRFQYDDALISLAGPNLVDTHGGTEVSLWGKNFGPTPFNFTGRTLFTDFFPPSGSPLAFPGFPSGFGTSYFTLTQQPNIPVACLVVNWGATDCATSCTDLDGNVARAIVARQCSTRVTYHNHNRVSFIAPGGGGANLLVSVSFYDILSGALLSTSNPVYISYYAPIIERVSPSIILIDDGSGAPSSVTVIGHQFGPAVQYSSNQVAQINYPLWVILSSSEPPSSTPTLVDVPCATTSRLPYDFGLQEYNIACTINSVITPVGQKSLLVHVAGQEGWAPGISQPSRGLLIGCKQGYYGSPSSPTANKCSKCPAVGAICKGFDGTTHNMPQALPGYFDLGAFLATSPSLSITCPVSPLAGGVCIVPCLNPDACGPSNTCNTGYVNGNTGFCSSCASGYFRNGGQCSVCPAGGQAILVFYALFCLAVIAGSYVLQKQGIMIGSASIGILFMQVIAMLSASLVAWPPILKRLFLVLAASFLDVQVVTPDCYIPNVTFRSEFTGILLLPIVIFGLLLILHLLVLLMKVVTLRPKKTWNRHLPILISTSLSMMFFMYIYETRTVLEVFNCRALPSLPATSGKFLAVTGEPCGNSSTAPYVAAAIAGLVIYVAGYFIFNAIFLYRNAERIMEDQLLRAKGVGEDRLTNPNAYTLRKSYGRMYYQYKPDFFWWQLIVLLRLFFIAFVPVIFNANGTYQMAICALVLMIAYGLQTTFNPYLCSSNNDEVIRLHSLSVFTSALHARLDASIKGIESQGRKRGHKNVLDYNGKVDKKALLGALSGFLGDYNTLEAVLLFLAFFVALMGTIYDGDLADNYPRTHDAVTALIIVVVIIGLCYWAAVVVTELYIYVTMKQREDSLLKRAASKRSSKKLDLEDDEDSGVKRSGSSKKLSKDKAFEAGNVEAAVNPLFANEKGATSSERVLSKSSGAAFDAQTTYEAMSAILNYSNPPPKEAWNTFQSAFADMAAQSIDLAAKQKALEAELEVLKSQVHSSEIVVNPIAKSSFSPTTTNSLSTYKSSSRRL